MTKTKLTTFDASEHSRTASEMAAYLDVTLEENPGDARSIAHALSEIARSQFMSKLAIDAGISRERLYRTLSGDESPDFQTILRVVEALGLRLSAEVAAG